MPLLLFLLGMPLQQPEPEFECGLQQRFEQLDMRTPELLASCRTLLLMLQVEGLSFGTTPHEDMGAELRMCQSFIIFERVHHNIPVPKI